MLKKESPVTVDIKSLVDITASKSAMYRALAYYGKCSMKQRNYDVNHLGQLFLPPKHMCTIEFLKQILQGKKSYFLNHDVPYVYVQKLERLTIKNVMEKVYDVPEVRQYLPDYPEHADRYMNRDFLFSIVNRIDSSFFRRVTSEIGARRKEKKAEEKPQTLEIQPDLLRILKEAQQEIRMRESHGDRRAMTSMLTSTKKRKRRELDQEHKLGLQTSIMIKRKK